MFSRKDPKVIWVGISLFWIHGWCGGNLQLWLAYCSCFSVRIHFLSVHLFSVLLKKTVFQWEQEPKAKETTVCSSTYTVSHTDLFFIFLLCLWICLVWLDSFWILQITNPRFYFLLWNRISKNKPHLTSCGSSSKVIYIWKVLCRYV